MSGGEVRVLRREPGQESPRMPAWKREILERRKAKGGGAGASESCQSAVTARVNGEVTGDNSGSINNETVSSSNRNFTITPASHHFAGKLGSTSVSPELSPVKTKKDPWSAIDRPESTTSENNDSDRGEQERLVLQDSLGPLQENPFIKLEKERKKRQDREAVNRPVQHILELYGNVPGIRTIRAENIIIIESDPDYFAEASGFKTGSKAQQNGTVSSYSSLSDLIDRRGSAVTEIRAKEVVIYDSSLSKSEENLSTIGRPGSDGGLGEGQGRVSRMLQKFDRNFGKLHPKSHSTENLLDLETSPIRPRLRPQAQPDLVPKSTTLGQLARAGHSPDRSQKASVFQSSMPSSQSSPDEQDNSSSLADPPPSVSSFCRRFEVRGECGEAERCKTKPLRQRESESPPKPKVPCSPERYFSHADPSSASDSPPPSPPSPGFEIRPSPRPDMSALPAGDIQARALANLRLQSRNSFTVIPKRRGPIASPGNTAPSSPVRSPPSPGPLRSMVELTPASVPTPPTPQPPSGEQESQRAEGQAKTEPFHPEPSAGPASSLLPLEPDPESTPTQGPAPEEPPPAADRLPITNIDDVEVEAPQPAPSPVVQRRTGNTFTVVPKRRQEPQPSSPEPLDPPPGPQAPYSQLGSLLKKRYPAVEDIEVIGGYLSLGRSCLSKTGSAGKKLKISFNESSLYSTFEYPSESSLWDGEEEEEEEEEEEGEEEEGEERVRIDRPSYTSSPSQTPNSTDLSNYTPKHSVDFSAWQEHKLDDPVFLGDSDSRRMELSTEEVMLTPADSSSHSDFSSEPALYF